MSQGASKKLGLHSGAPEVVPPVHAPVLTADGQGSSVVQTDLTGRLPTNLRSRHINMIALGGVIGAGLFVGSGAGVAVAGPGIVLSYLAAGVLALLVMKMLAELTASMPANGSFSVHAERALGRWAGFTAGWLYWLMLVVVLAIEANAAAAIVQSWLPGTSRWLWVLVTVVVFTLVNLAAVGTFGEFEFWFAAIKVLAILAFLTLGVLAIMGLLPQNDPVGLSNLTGHGGLLPHGWSGVLTGLLAVVFAFGGLELVAIAAAETDDPGRQVGRAVTSAVWRILLFYVGSLAVVVTLLPWDAVDVAQSPYVAVLDRIGVAPAGTLMNVVVLVAVLSALNANLYGASRMLHSLSLRREAPAALLKLGRGGVPQRAVVASVGFGFLSVILSAVWPTTIFSFLLNAIGSLILVIWLLIACTQLRFRRLMVAEGRALPVRMWLHPYLTWFAIAVMLVIIVLLVQSGAGSSLICTAVLVGAVLIAAAIREVLLRRAVPINVHGVPR